MFREADLREVAGTALTVAVAHESFDAWWRPFTLGVGPAGAYVAGLDDGAREALRERCRRRVGEGPGTTRASAWTVVAKAPSAAG
jgi:hypothetical protein